MLRRMRCGALKWSFEPRIDPARGLIFGFISPDLRRLTALGRNAYVEPIAPCEIIASTNANPRWNVRYQFIVVGIILLKYAYKPLCTNDVNAFPGRIKVNVVALSGSPKPCDFSACFSVKNDHHGSFAGNSEETMIFFVQSHGIVGAQPLKRPFGHCASLAVEGFDYVSRVRYVHIDVAPGSLNLK